MTEGERVEVSPSSALATLVLERFDVSIRDVPFAVRGEESIGWRGSSPDGERFVQLFPIWRTAAGLTWCDSVARAASSGTPAAIHAIASDGGQVVVPSEDGLVMVFPFVAGTHPEGPQELVRAALTPTQS